VDRQGAHIYDEDHCRDGANETKHARPDVNTTNWVLTRNPKNSDLVFRGRHI
jgi:hypothetical protein